MKNKNKNDNDNDKDKDNLEEYISSRFKKISTVKLDPFADTHIENDPTYSNQGGPMNAWRFK